MPKLKRLKARKRKTNTGKKTKKSRTEKETEIMEEEGEELPVEASKADEDEFIALEQKEASRPDPDSLKKTKRPRAIAKGEYVLVAGKTQFRVVDAANDPLTRMNAAAKGFKQRHFDRHKRISSKEQASLQHKLEAKVITK